MPFRQGDPSFRENGNLLSRYIDVFIASRQRISSGKTKITMLNFSRYSKLLTFNVTFLLCNKLKDKASNDID